MNEKGTELIVAEKLNTEVLFTKAGELEKVLDMIERKVDEFLPDLETAAGRKEIASFSRKVSSSKAFLDKIRKAQNAKAKAEIDGRNIIWNPAKKKLETWRDDVRQPLSDWEAAEKLKDDDRKDKLKSVIGSWSKALYALNGVGTVQELESYIAMLEAVKAEIDPVVWFDFTTEAEETSGFLIDQAKSQLETRKRLDAEETERKAEAARQAKVAAEQAKIAADQKAAQDKIDAANRKIEEEKRTVREGALKNLDLYRDGLAGEHVLHLDPEFRYDGKPMWWNEIVALSDSDFDNFTTELKKQIATHKKDAEKKAEQEQKDREEFERQAKIKAEADAKEAAAQAERDRIAKVESDRVEDERIENAQFGGLERKQHLFKLADAFFDNLIIDDCEYGGIGLHSKRPFGNSYVQGDILEIIGIPFNEEEYTKEQEDYADDLYVSLIPFLNEKWTALREITSKE